MRHGNDEKSPNNGWIFFGFSVWRNDNERMPESAIPNKTCKHEYKFFALDDFRVTSTDSNPNAVENKS